VAPELIQYVKRKTSFKSRREQKFADLPRYTITNFQLKGKEIVVADNASFLFMQKEIFEDHIYKFHTSKKEPYIIDGGANIGLATIYLKLLYPFSKIVAFEPDSYIFEILKTNIHAFDLKGIELINKGLWNKNTTLSFQSEGADGGLITDIDEKSVGTQSIEVISLKPYLNQTIDFLKLDIEGSETHVLKDIEKELVNVDRIFVEYHSFVEQPQTLNKIINILQKANFRLYISSPGLSNKAPFVNIKVYKNMDMQLNIYGFKEKIK
jgi:FkbM family methyltransferase